MKSLNGCENLKIVVHIILKGQVNTFVKNDVIVLRISEETTEAPTIAEVVVETVGNAVGVASLSTGNFLSSSTSAYILICSIITGHLRKRLL